MIVEFEGQQHNFPDDAKPEEISKALSAIPPKPSVAEDVKSQVLPSLASGVGHLIAAPHEVANIGMKGLDWLAQKTLPESVSKSWLEAGKKIEGMGGIPRPGDVTQAFDQSLPEPKTTEGKYTRAVLQAAPLGALGSAKNILPNMAIAGASGAGGEAGEQLTGSPYGQIAGALLGAGLGAKTVGRLGAPASAAVPTAEELKLAGGRGYDSARNMGVEIKPSSVVQAATDLKSGLENQGIIDAIAPKTHAVLDQLKTPPPGAVSATIDNFRAARRAFGELAGGADATERKAARDAIKGLDSYLENIPQGHLIAGDAQAASKVLSEANSNYAAAMRSEDVGARLTRAERQAAKSGSGTNIDNAIRQKISAVLDSKTGTRGWTQEEIAQAEKVVRGTTTGNILRKVGKLGFNDGLSLMLHAGVTLPSGGMNIPIGIAGTAARKIGEALTKRQANKLDELIRSRSALANQQMVPSNYVPPSTKAAIARALLIQQQGNQ